MKQAYAQYVCLLNWLKKERKKRKIPKDEEAAYGAQLGRMWEAMTDAERAEVEATKR